MYICTHLDSTEAYLDPHIIYKFSIQRVFVTHIVKYTNEVVVT